MWNRTHNVRLLQCLIELAWLQRQQLVEVQCLAQDLITLGRETAVSSGDDRTTAHAFTLPELKGRGVSEPVYLAILCRRLCANSIRPQSLPIISLPDKRVTFHCQDQCCSVWSICLYHWSHAESYSNPPLWDHFPAKSIAVTDKKITSVKTKFKTQVKIYCTRFKN